MQQGAWHPGPQGCTTTPRTPPNGRSATPRLSPSQRTASSPAGARLSAGEDAGLICKRPPTVPSPSRAAGGGAVDDCSASGGGVLAELRELLARETRERADGQQALTLKLQQQQASIAHVAMQVDEALSELRASASFARQGPGDRGLEGKRTIYSPGAGGSRQGGLDGDVELDDSVAQSIRELISSEMESTNVALAEVRESLLGLEHRLSAPGEGDCDGEGKGTGVEGCDFDASCQAAESDQETDEAVLDRLIEAKLEVLREERASQAAELEAQMGDIEAKLKEEWKALHGWVDAAVVAVIQRITSLECQVQVAERRRESALEETAGSYDDEGADADASCSPSWEDRGQPFRQRPPPAHDEVTASQGPCSSTSPAVRARARTPGAACVDTLDAGAEGARDTFADSEPAQTLAGRALYAELVQEPPGDRSASASATPSAVTPTAGSASVTLPVASMRPPTPTAAGSASVTLPVATAAASASGSAGGSGSYPPWGQHAAAVAAASAGCGGSGSYAPPRSQVALPRCAPLAAYDSGSLSHMPIAQAHGTTTYVQSSLQVVAPSRARPVDPHRASTPTTTAYTATVVRSSSAGGIPGLPPARATSLGACHGSVALLAQARHAGTC